MSGRIVKAMSLLLCAVVVAGCCLVGCEQDKRPTDYNEITKQDIYDAFKELYPDAELNAEEHKLYLNKDGEYPIIGNYWLDLDSVAIPEEFSFNIKSAEDVETILNCYMKLFYDDWTDDNMEEFFEFYTITDDSVEDNYSEDYEFHGWTFSVFYDDRDSEIFIYLLNL